MLQSLNHLPLWTWAAILMYKEVMETIREQLRTSPHPLTWERGEGYFFSGPFEIQGLVRDMDIF